MDKGKLVQIIIVFIILLVIIWIISKTLPNGIIKFASGIFIAVIAGLFCRKILYGKIF
ncbi:MAG: hypothetical protein ISP01_06770 [Methanobrevibacter arboriphilus]|uniref:Uncharacterized protein n=1 Tax=Methanobrevibacter arboriphilus TaxID=39441 RepID=A0A843AH75_METAZ|nr:hypothetical protein [Methanobrevibacter arboriphilus]MBF4469091.1 hypothetical protein [Methanobrevibacter arboriphilus]